MRHQPDGVSNHKLQGLVREVGQIVIGGAPAQLGVQVEDSSITDRRVHPRGARSDERAPLEQN